MRRRHYDSDVVVLVIVIKMVVYRWEVVRVRVGSKKSNRMTLDTMADFVDHSHTRWRALLALEPDLMQPPTCSATLMAQVTTWRLCSPPPALVIDAR